VTFKIVCGHQNWFDRVKLDGKYQPRRNFLVKANYTYVWRQKKEGASFGPVPTNQINGEIRYDFDTGLWLDFRVHWQDSSDCTMGLNPSNVSTISTVHLSPEDIERLLNNLEYFSSWHRLEGYWLGDLSMGYTPPNKFWKLAFGIHNIFHERFRQTSDGPKADTTVTARFSMVF